MTILKVLPISMLFYLMAWMIAPLEIVYYPSIMAFLLLALMFLSMFLGILCYQLSLGKNYRRYHVREEIVLQSAKKLLKVVLFLAVLGLTLRMLDKLLIRDMLSYDSAVARRDADSEASALGIISVPLYSLLLTLPAFISYFNFTKIRKLALIILFSIPSIEVMFMGSRGLVVTTLFMFFIYYGAVSKMRLRHVIFAAIFVLIVLYVSSAIFVDRITSYGFSPLYSAFNSAYAYTLVPNTWAAHIIDEGGFISLCVFAIVNFFQYFLHGFLEFSYLIDHFQYVSYQDGAYTFRVFGKLFGASTGAENITPRSGVYTTFLGPLWVDFGVLSLFFCFLWGWIMALSYNKVKRGLIQYLPLYAYMGAVAFFSPVVNLIQNALGVYVLLACIIFIFMFWLLKLRLETTGLTKVNFLLR